MNRRDRRAIRLADKHYSREVVGSPQVGGSGHLVILVTPEGDACWITIRQPVPTHRWKDSWVCSMFRNESGHLSSELIREAVAVTRYLWGPALPLDGFITFVNEEKTRRKRDPGRCYRKAGWQPCGRSAGGLFTLQLLPENFDPPGATSWGTTAGGCMTWGLWLLIIAFFPLLVGAVAFGVLVLAAPWLAVLGLLDRYAEKSSHD